MNRKVVYVITRPERGGAQSHLLELLNGVSHRKNILLVCGKDVDMYLANEAQALGIRALILPQLVHHISPINDLKAMMALTRLLKRERPDLVHVHSSKAGLLTRIAAHLARIPSVFTAHGWAFTEGAVPLRRALAIILERLAAVIGTRIIAVSHYDRELGIRSRVGQSSQVITIHNALSDCEFARPAAMVAGQSMRIAMIARFAPPKDQALLLRAAANVPNVQLVFLGDGPLFNQAQQLAASLGSNAEFLGSRTDVPEVLAGCHAFALISKFEGFPISTLEAMRAALPVIVSDVGGASEALSTSGEPVGLLVPRGDQSALETALRTLASDSALADRMGQAARQHFLRHFTVERMLALTWEVYEEAIEAGPVGKRKRQRA
jgi:glycosyltransferase involved in cell wall biosynthesis